LFPNFDLARILVGTIYNNATSPPSASWLFGIDVEEEVPRNLRWQFACCQPCFSENKDVGLLEGVIAEDRLVCFLEPM